MASRDGDRPEPRSFTSRLPRLDGPVRYRVTTAPVASRRFEVKAVEPPTVASITANVEPPPYTKLPAGPARDPARLDVVVRMAIAFAMTTNRPVASVELAWPTFATSGEALRTIEASNGTVRVGAEAAGS